MASESTTIEVDGPNGVREIRISSPSRVLWPEVGITKLDLATYLAAVGGPFVEANGDRPISLQRFGGDVTGEFFFSKNPPKGAPEWIRSVVVTYPSARAHPQLVIDEPAAAVWAGQMNTLVFHAWPSRADTSDYPDQLRIDLDPQPGTAFAEARTAAFGMREVLAEAGLTAFVKTSGNRGLHLYAPITPDHEFLDVRHAVIAAARELERRTPETVTTAWWKELRGERIFLDFNQAARDRTIAGAYSPRALPGATVSTPVTWEELEAGVDPLAFTMRTVPKRLLEVGDPWAGMSASAAGIETLLGWWQRDLDAGLGEMPFPPDYPKMPGEPPRVQPSRKNADNWDAAVG
ncbi:non-homologous end-joining DNA ligase [Amnibacterium sp.]|uniref:non-homologous end-joining DNA ligase n=1 Tax=Amnibacterium sp. TaxID=1872496 RepID=UPI00261C8FD5|nr:non-homologous end-joining DNA ligase [Amnibacterium sp.]MCU1473609.1 ligase [Amnibacterium sp.]